MYLINEFIKDKKVDIVENEMSEEQLRELFTTIGFVPGEQFIEFVRKYSYFAYGAVEFFGINSALKEKSNLFSQTKRLVDTYQFLKGYYIVAYYGEGMYDLIDSEDNIYEFYEGESEVAEPLEIKFFDYVLKKFQEEEAFLKNI